jgi:hypothetical protein
VENAIGSRAVIPLLAANIVRETTKGQSAVRLMFGIDSSGDPESRTVADNASYGRTEVTAAKHNIPQSTEFQAQVYLLKQ